MNTMKRTFAAFLLAGAAISLATPAMAAEGPALNWESNVQSQNGLLNLATNGNVCASLTGVLAPGAACSNS